MPGAAGAAGTGGEAAGSPVGPAGGSAGSGCRSGRAGEGGVLGPRLLGLVGPVRLSRRLCNKWLRENRGAKRPQAGVKSRLVSSLSRVLWCEIPPRCRVLPCSETPLAFGLMSPSGAG